MAGQKYNKFVLKWLHASGNKFKVFYVSSCFQHSSTKEANQGEEI